MKIKEEQEVLSSMLDQSIESNSGFSNEPPTEALKPEPVFTIDYKKIQRKANNKAKKLLKQALLHIMPLEVIETNDFVKDKMQIDIITLSGMIYQLELNQSMQEKLSEEIANGSTSPRMFETFNDASRTNIEINKQLIATIEVLKQSYKGINYEIREKLEQDSLPDGGPIKALPGADGSKTFFGSKSLIADLNGQKKYRVVPVGSDNIVDSVAEEIK